VLGAAGADPTISIDRLKPYCPAHFALCLAYLVPVGVIAGALPCVDGLPVLDSPLALIEPSAVLAVVVRPANGVDNAASRARPRRGALPILCRTLPLLGSQLVLSGEIGRSLAVAVALLAVSVGARRTDVGRGNLTLDAKLR
jgi:hypothetical protein